MNLTKLLLFISILLIAYVNAAPLSEENELLERKPFFKLTKEDIQFMKKKKPQVELEESVKSQQKFKEKQLQQLVDNIFDPIIKEMEEIISQNFSEQ